MPSLDLLFLIYTAWKIIYYGNQYGSNMNYIRKYFVYLPVLGGFIHKLHIVITDVCLHRKI